MHPVRGRLADPQGVYRALDTNLRELTADLDRPGLYEQIGQSIYSQVATTLFNSPGIGIRNLLQNVAWYTRPEEFLNVRSLSAGDRRYFERRLDMEGAIHEEFLRLRADSGRFGDAVPGIRQLNWLADHADIIGRTDYVNRIAAYSAKIGTVRKAIAANPGYATDPDALAGLMRASGLGELTVTQRNRALEKLAHDGPDEYARYVAEAITRKVHFSYERYLKPPASQGSSLAKAMDNLLTFPRSRLQGVAHDLARLDPQERQAAGHTYHTGQALRALLAGVAGGYVADEIAQAVTGSRARPYATDEMILGNLNLGGLMYEGPDSLGSFAGDAYAAAQGDRAALKRATDALPQMKSYFLPFADTIVSMTEAAMGADQLDAYAARQLRGALDTNYTARGLAEYRVERSSPDTVRHFVFGTVRGSKPQSTASRPDPRRRR